MKVLVLFGTRPEAIKMCPVVKELEKYPEEFDTIVCSTGQHREMLDQVLQCFSVQPDYDLNIMQVNQTLCDIGSLTLERFKDVLEKENPDIVLVHGDTSTAMFGALAAFYFQIPVGHVEAGLRTNNLYDPFPEELNRQIIDKVAAQYYCPTQQNVDALLKEGVDKHKIILTGNTVIDALKYTVTNKYQNNILDWAGNNFILLTAHRRENIGRPMEDIFRAINQITKQYNVKVIYPVHKNPRVREIADKMFAGNDNVKLIEPLNPLDCHNIMAKAHLVVTDSGGLTEEAPALNVPVVIVREETERPEAVAKNCAVLAGTNTEYIYWTLDSLLKDEHVWREMSEASNPYGDGTASQKIVESLRRWKQ